MERLGDRFFRLIVRLIVENIENRIGLVGLYGADNFAIHRHPSRRAGALQSLFVEEICFPGILETKQFEADEIILDSGWAAIASVDADATKYFYEAQQNIVRSRHLPVLLLQPGHLAA